LRLRPARAADAPTIRAMVRGARLNPLGLDWRRFWLIVDDEDAVLACAQMRPHRDGTLELASLVVRQPWRGRGLARALISHLLAQHPDQEVYLMCRANLGPFYQHFGFRRLDETDMPRYFRRIQRLANRLMWRSEALWVMRRET